MKAINNKNISLIKEKLLQAHKIAIISHENPDGDTIGSAIALSLLLKALNKRTYLLINDNMPEFLRWLPEAKNYIIFEEEPEKVKNIIETADVLVHIDYNSLGRTGKMEKVLSKFRGFSIMIDHHPSPEDIADFSFSYPQYSSTAEVLYNFLVLADWADLIDKDIATAIYVGIITDTGNFTFNSSSPQLFRIVAELLEKGIDKDDIYAKVFYNFSLDRMRLVGFALSQRMEFWQEYSTAFIYLYQKDLKQFNHQKGDTENLVNMIFYIRGVKFALLFIEKKDHIKISLRSRGDFPANYVAKKYFYGGGHLNAAGGKYFASMEETLSKLKEILKSDDEIKKHI
jgi:phosphoesterase RecJ-like protein